VLARAVVVAAVPRGLVAAGVEVVDPVAHQEEKGAAGAERGAADLAGADPGVVGAGEGPHPHLTTPGTGTLLVPVLTHWSRNP